MHSVGREEYLHAFNFRGLCRSYSRKKKVSNECWIFKNHFRMCHLWTENPIELKHEQSATSSIYNKYRDGMFWPIFKRYLCFCFSWITAVLLLMIDLFENGHNIFGNQVNRMFGGMSGKLKMMVTANDAKSTISACNITYANIFGYAWCCFNIGNVLLNVNIQTITYTYFLSLHFPHRFFLFSSFQWIF